MRHVLKSLVKGVSGFGTILMLALSFAPATSAELAALGSNHQRLERVQMRIAKTMLTVAPDFAVAKFAEMTDLPPRIVRAQLEATAAGRTGGRQPNSQVLSSAESVQPTQRRFEAGGALFVKPD